MGIIYSRSTRNLIKRFGFKFLSWQHANQIFDERQNLIEFLGKFVGYVFFLQQIARR
jgi:hypothetical protein